MSYVIGIKAGNDLIAVEQELTSYNEALAAYQERIVSISAAADPVVLALVDTDGEAASLRESH